MKHSLYPKNHERKSILAFLALFLSKKLMFKREKHSEWFLDYIYPEI